MAARERRAPARWSLRRGEKGYPDPLEDLGSDAPAIIYGLGSRAAVSELEHEATVTIVGSRRASPYGVRIAEQLARELAGAGVTVVSGMARGIDAAAHRGALAGGGTTLAILAGGPDRVYPRANAGIYRELVEAGGAAVAEHPPGTRPERWSFPVRNRIMAALAKLVVVVEAAEPSGSLITAREAFDRLGREVGAVPGQVGTPTAEGANNLLRDGAHVITGAEDVLDRLAGVGVRRVERSGGPPVSIELGRALELVAAGVSTADGLAAAGFDPARAAIALARLEALGYLTCDPSGAYARSSLPLPLPRTGRGDSPG